MTADRDEMERQQARSDLSASHRKLVLAAARQYQRADLANTDLVGAGQRDMLAAMDHVDPLSNPGTHAVRWIRHYIQDHIDQQAAASGAGSATSLAQWQLARCADRLFADARRACRRECVEPSEAELCARAAARVGLTAEQVAEWRAARDASNPDEVPDAAVPPASFEPIRLRRRVHVLMQEILGERERTVFFARCMTEPMAVRHRDSLAAELGVTRDRVYELEVSAKRKMAAALAREGLAGPRDPKKRRSIRRPAGSSRCPAEQ